MNAMVQPTPSHVSHVLAMRNDVAEVARRMKAKGRAFLMVSGTSMMPWIRPGDVVFARKTEIESVARGDVVLFERDGHLCIHRVIAVSSSLRRFDEDMARLLTTKGDAVAAEDEAISSSSLFGKVALLRRNGKEINLESWRMRLLGRFLAALSSSSAAWQPIFRCLWRTVRRISPSASGPNTKQ